MNVFIAIDDTDNTESIGTGRLSRNLGKELSRLGMIKNMNVTRHQFLVHPDIPYTSHNSCSCIAAFTDSSLDDIFKTSQDFLVNNFHESANPGLCVIEDKVVPDELRTFGYRAKREVLTINEARTLAEKLRLNLWWYGETGQGCIGAIAGVGLRSTGDDGRFIDLHGIRDIEGTATVKDIISKSDVKKVVTLDGKSLPDHEIIETDGWVRPSLYGGEIVFYVIRDGDTWRPDKTRV